MSTSKFPIALVDKSTVIGFFVIIILALSVPFFGGWDFLHAVRPETLSRQFTYTYYPYPAYWFFYPLAILPPQLGYTIWNLVNAASVIFAVRYWKTNLLAFSLSIPCFWIFYAGQIDGFFAGALTLAIAANPWLAGFGIFVLTFKPQAGLIPILFVLLQRRDWRILVLPLVLYLLSFVEYGWWILEWLDHMKVGFGTHLLNATNISIFPLGLIFLFLLFRYKDSLKIWMLAGSLATPYFPVYSLATFFTIESPKWWFSLSMWLFYLAWGIFHLPYYVTQILFAFPLTLLVMEIWKYEKSRALANSHATQFIEKT